jgi:hypothetical protein
MSAQMLEAMDSNLKWVNSFLDQVMSSMESNSISMLDQSTPLMAKDKILKCTLSITLKMQMLLETLSPLLLVSCSQLIIILQTYHGLSKNLLTLSSMD